ncbi:MAG: hypothetical protein FWE37_00835 [Spirochaetaceae bacterium]|nr:hypothetical protein [Spirochaetaceae bacterium]
MIAEVFISNGLQAIRLPKEIRLQADKVKVEQTAKGIVISPVIEKSDWHKILDDAYGCCPNFSTERETLNDTPREIEL